MTLSDEILNLWKGTAQNLCKEVDSITHEGCLAWGIITRSRYGVAIPNEYSISINESFANVDLVSEQLIVNDKSVNAILLLTDSLIAKEPFSFLCAEFVQVGKNKRRREEIASNPLAWWHQWKDLLGNKSVDEMVYDTLGELVTLYYLASQGKSAEWSGPSGATYDIDCDGNYVEVKSSKARNKREITLSNEFQLEPPPGSSLHLMFCQFEDAQSGLSINCLVDLLANIGYDRGNLNDKLRKKGLALNKSARDRMYMLHAMHLYKIDDTFPAIRPTSFVGGQKPTGVQSYTYSVTLDGIQGTPISFQKDDKINDLQNN